MLKIITIGIPLSFLVSAAIGGIAYERLSADRTKWARAVVYNALGGELDAQRKMADCYKVGCAYGARDPVYECAWRQVILQEDGHKKLSADVNAERQSCAAVRPSDHTFVNMARKEIDHQMNELQGKKP